MQPAYGALVISSLSVLRIWLFLSVKYAKLPPPTPPNKMQVNA